MSRIGATLVAFEQLLLNQWARHEQAARTSALRLSTGEYLQFPQEDPSRFLQIQQWEQQQRGLQDLQENIAAAANLGAEAQIAVDEIRTQLESIRAALLEDENGDLSTEERTARQVAIDGYLNEVRALAGQSLHGRRLLDGSLNYTLSGQNPTQISRIEVLSLNSGTTLSGSVASAATRASVTYTGAAGAINSGDATWTLRGKRGTTTVAVEDAEDLTDIRDRINAASHDTGITADVSGDNLVFTSVDYGSAAIIDIDVVSGAFATAGTTAGTDAVVTLNGQAIAAQHVDGNLVRFQHQEMHLQLTLQTGYVGALSSITLADDAVARFQLSTNPHDTAIFAAPGLLPELLGGISGRLSDLASGGTLAGLGANASQALRVVDEALQQLTLTEGRVAAFADVTVAAAARLTDAFVDTLDDSLEQLNGVDDEAEEARLARYEALASNTAAAMAIVRQSQQQWVSILQQIAGL